MNSIIMMKSINDVYKLYTEHINNELKQQADRLNMFDVKFSNELINIKTQYKMKLVEEKFKLLNKICQDNNLDFDKMKEIYMKPKELKLLNITPVNNEDADKILDKIEYNGSTYYCDTTKDKGIVYNMNSKQVGFINNGKVTITN